jgi:hypothetical protein
MKLLIAAATIFCAFQAFAFQDGRYVCAHRTAGPGQTTLPADIYTVKTVTVDGVKVPYLQVLRHLRSNNPAGFTQYKAHGFAAAFSSENGTTLVLGALQLAFEQGEVRGCRLE